MTILTSTAVLWFARAALVLALTLVATRVLARVPAAIRHGVLAAGFVAVLALPVIAWLVPAWHTGALPAAPSVAPPAVTISAEPNLPVAEPSSAPSEAPLAAPAGSSSVPWSAIAFALWGTGAALLLARAAVGAVRARRIAARATVARSRYAADAWRALDGAGEPPRLVESDEVESPIVVGALAPVVVVPRASSEWTADRWRVVLLHELAHVRRKDALANVAAQVACALHWMNPLAWMAARRLREERELAADDAVLRAGARPSSYAEHLVAIAVAHTGGLQVDDVSGAALAMAEHTRFEARVTALLDAGRSRTPTRARHAAGVTAAMTLVATVAACMSPEAGGASNEAVTSAGASNGTTPAAVSSGTTPAGAPPTASMPTSSDPALQALAERELDAAIRDDHASGATAIVLDARTGAVVAIAARGDFDPRAPFAPGSTMKPFTFAAALDSGAVTLDARIDCENGKHAYGDRAMTDSSPNGVLDLASILAVSSNVGTAKLAEPLGDRLADYLRRFHFAAPAHLDTRSFAGAAIASGEALPASALDVASGYTAFADDGIYHAPDGTTSERAVTKDTARAVLGMLERVVTDEHGTGHAARIPNVRVAGKTGTAHHGEKYYASFVGIVPADAPRFVILVGVDGVDGYGGKVAAPVFATLATAALAK